MATYTKVDSGLFESFLQSKGFSRTTFHNEVVYEKPSAIASGLVVKVYTSIRIGAESARDVGRDAIRIVVILQSGDKSYPIYKGARVYRTTSQQSVHDRTAQRIDDAEARCLAWKAEQNKKLATAPEQKPELYGDYAGSVGEEMRSTLHVSYRKTWNDKFIFILKDDSHRTFCYWSLNDRLQVGEAYHLRFRIIMHKLYNGVRQTIISEVFGKPVVK